MTYEEFYYSIDCKFPYHDEAAWKHLIAVAHDIGGDAPFLVLHEICRVPASEVLDPEKHLAMYEFWKASFSSPVQKIVEPACLSYINKQELSDFQAIEIMDKLAQYPRNFNALQVVLFSCNDERDLVDEKYGKIIEQWAAI